MSKIMWAALAGALLTPIGATAQTTDQSGTATTGTGTTGTATPDAGMAQPGMAQSGTATGDTGATDTTMTPASTGPTAPDGTRAFGIEPYVGVMGGYEDFDSDNDGPLTTRCNGRSGCPDGGFVEALAGINIPLGPLFVGAEGSVAKGFNGIDWEYAAYGRVGFRAGSSGLIYGKAGREWIHTDDKGNNNNISYGMGVEVGPKSIGLGGITNNAGVRLRLEMTTYDLKSIRPAAGVIFHF